MLDRDFNSAILLQKESGDGHRLTQKRSTWEHWQEKPALYCLAVNVWSYVTQIFF